MSEHGIEAAGRFNLVEGLQAAQEDDQKREYMFFLFRFFLGKERKEKKKNETTISKLFSLL